MASLVLDTGGIYAVLDASDANHKRCAAALRQFDDLILPPLVLVEVDYWCRKSAGGVRAFARFVSDISAGAYRLEQLLEVDVVRASELEVEYAALELGLVDASVIALCERLDQDTVLTLDRRDFSVVKPRHRAAMRLVPD